MKRDAHHPVAIALQYEGQWISLYNWVQTKGYTFTHIIWLQRPSPGDQELWDRCLYPMHLTTEEGLQVIDLSSKNINFRNMFYQHGAAYSRP